MGWTPEWSSELIWPSNFVGDFTFSFRVERIVFLFFFSLSFVGFGQIEGIAYDWTAKNIYWTDQGKKIIGVGRQDGSYQKILLTVGLSKPRAIVVHPSMG